MDKARQNLVPVALPDLSRSDENVQVQARQLYATLNQALDDRRKPSADLGTAYGKLGMLLQAGEYYDAAEPCYRNAQTLTPTEVRWVYYLGLLHTDRGETERAEGDFKRVLELQPDDVATLIRLARLYFDDGRPDEVTRRYERLHEDPDTVTAGWAERINPPPHYHVRRVELRNAAGAVTRQFDAGETMEIHLWSSGRAPENSYTAEFKLFNDRDELVSFGSANPVRDTYYVAEDQHLVCRLGPLPLTEGSYTFSFTLRVWNQDRWDFWERAIGFDILRCDLFKTGHSVTADHNGSFVIAQEWLTGD